MRTREQLIPPVSPRQMLVRCVEARALLEVATEALAAAQDALVGQVLSSTHPVAEALDESYLGARQALARLELYIARIP